MGVWGGEGMAGGEEPGEAIIKGEEILLPECNIGEVDSDSSNPS